MVLLLILRRVFLNFLGGQASLHLLRLLVKSVLIRHLVILVLSGLVLLLSVLFPHLWLVDLFLAGIRLVLLFRWLLRFLSFFLLQLLGKIEKQILAISVHLLSVDIVQLLVFVLVGSLVVFNLLLRLFFQVRLLIVPIVFVRLDLIIFEHSLVLVFLMVFGLLVRVVLGYFLLVLL